MGKRLNVTQMVQKKYTLVDGLSDELKAAIGEIEDTFTAIIYGGSGMGKTNFLVKLLKELKPVGDMLYISYEEAHGKTIQDLILRHNLQEDLPNLRFSDGETIDELMALLKRKRSPKVIVMDSWQFSHLKYEDYELLKKTFVFGKTPGKRKIFLIISHVNNSGTTPDGRSAIDIKKDSNIKILVEGFIAIVKVSRYGSKRNLAIWEHGAKQYWGAEKYKKLMADKSEKTKKPAKPKAEIAPPVDDKVTTLELFNEETEEEKTARILKNLKES